MKTNFQLVSDMHRKFNLSEFKKGPRQLTREEHQFRILAMFEELIEYIQAVYEADNIDFNSTVMNIIKFVTDPIDGIPLKENPCLEDQFDALLDLAIFTMGTADRQNLPWDNGFERVMEANMAKELGQNGDKRGGFKRDLVKPEGWRPPILSDLIEAQAQIAMIKASDSRSSVEDVHTKDELYEQSITRQNAGLIILDGPDCSGKTTLANALRDQLGANVVHRTWSEDLEKQMDRYLMDPINIYRKDDLLVIDRWALSEWIYSDVYRNGTQWKGFHRLAFEKLRQLNAINVVCVPDDFNEYLFKYRSEFESRDEMYDFDENKLFKIWQYYSRASDGLTNFMGTGIKLFNVVHYDMLKTDARSMVQRLSNLTLVK